jgi:hypothetical protein
MQAAFGAACGERPALSAHSVGHPVALGGGQKIASVAEQRKPPSPVDSAPSQEHKISKTARYSTADTGSAAHQADRISRSEVDCRAGLIQTADARRQGPIAVICPSRLTGSQQVRN